jgi:phosphocarrier protein
MFVKVANRHRAELWIEKEGACVNGKSIMGLMMLAAGKGATLKLIAEGHDASKMLSELQELIENRFGEE